MMHLKMYVTDRWEYDMEPDRKNGFQDWEIYMALIVAIASED